MRVVIGGGKDDQPRPSCVDRCCAIAFTVKYVLYKNPKPTQLCSAVDIPAVNVRKVGAGVGKQTPFFFGREGCSRHTIRVNAISCSSQSLSLARPDRSSAFTSCT